MTGIRLARTSQDELSVEIARLHYLKQYKEKAESTYRDQEEKIVKILEALEQSSATRKTSFGQLKATVVKRHNTKINEVGLKKALGAAMWKKVTKTVLDKPKLEGLIADGEIDPTVVAAHATVDPVKPYIRLSAVEEDAEKERDAT